ncbi:hypothetical protein STEG23_022042 [Scotinomys teguina]
MLTLSYKKLMSEYMKNFHNSKQRAPNSHWQVWPAGASHQDLQYCKGFWLTELLDNEKPGKVKEPEVLGLPGTLLAVSRLQNHTGECSRNSKRHRRAPCHSGIGFFILVLPPGQRELSMQPRSDGDKH